LDSLKTFPTMRYMGRLQAVRLAVQRERTTRELLERLALTAGQVAIRPDAVAPVQLTIDPLIAVARAALLQRLGDGFHRQRQLRSLGFADRLPRAHLKFECGQPLVNGFRPVRGLVQSCSTSICSRARFCTAVASS
jgi:hypothetical protein